MTLALVALACGLSSCGRQDTSAPGGAGTSAAGAQPAGARAAGVAAPNRAAALDRADASLPIPESTPRIDPRPVLWSVARRARMLHDDGLKAQRAGDLKAALSGLAGAVQLDPGRISARLDLARLYAQAGRGSVALELLAPMGDDLQECGACIESLHHAKDDPQLAAVWATARGKKLLAAAAKARLPWQKWAHEASQSLVDGTGRLLPSFIHANVPFVLVRSCPTCSNPERRPPQRRQLAGGRVAVKLASRFNTTDGRLGGVPLQATGPATRQGRCMRWAVPSPVPVGTAALQALCFRPISAERAALTRVDIIYGRSKADVARTAK